MCTKLILADCVLHITYSVKHNALYIYFITFLGKIFTSTSHSCYAYHMIQEKSLFMGDNNPHNFLKNTIKKRDDAHFKQILLSVKNMYE